MPRGRTGSSQRPMGEQFQSSFLVAFMYVLAIALGALWFVTIQHLTNAKWSVVVRRVAEIIAAGVPVIAALFALVLVPVLAGHSHLYEWLDLSQIKDPALLHALEHKAGYLNLKFFLARCGVYFGFWW